MTIRYTVESPEADLYLLHGQVPISHLAALYNTFPKHYVQSLRFDVLLPNVTVVGSPQKLDSFFLELANGIVGQGFRQKLMTEHGLSAELAEWFIFGDRGVSSKTMVALVTGYGKTRGDDPFTSDTPHDLYDLRRCILLEESVPEIQAGMDKVAAGGSVWKSLVDNWQALKFSLNSELPDWRTAKKLSECTKSRALLDSCLKKQHAPA